MQANTAFALAMAQEWMAGDLVWVRHRPKTPPNANRRQSMPTKHNHRRYRCAAVCVVRVARRPLLRRPPITAAPWQVLGHCSLLTLPAMLRRKVPRDLRLGLFIHLPFPSTELYRVIPNRRELLEGMLGADLIGFHSFSYSRHFLSACGRILGLDADIAKVEYRRHATQIKIMPMGTDPEFWTRLLEMPAVQARLSELDKNFNGKQVILGVDRLDYIKGIPLKLLAFECFLERNEELHGEVVLVQVAHPPMRVGLSALQENREYTDLQAELNELVGRINGRFSTVDWQPIYYINKWISANELAALYRIADVAFFTSIREGINVICYEMAAAQAPEVIGPLGGIVGGGPANSKQAVVIISEFSGGARSLGGALHVNPWHAGQVADTLLTAQQMSGIERKLRHDAISLYVREHTSRLWALRLCTELQAIIPSDQAGSIRILPALKSQASELYTALGKSRTR